MQNPVGFTRYWRFQLATIGVTVLSGSLSNSLTAMLDQPTSMLWELGQSLPQVAVYFLATVLSSALVLGPLSLLRLPLLVQLTWTGLANRLRAILCLSSTQATASQRRAEIGELRPNQRATSWLQRQRTVLILRPWCEPRNTEQEGLDL